jgi:hypothetical protein
MLFSYILPGRPIDLYKILYAYPVVSLSIRRSKCNISSCSI